MTIDEMMGRMSGAEFAWWKRFHERQPIGMARADLHAAMIAQAIYAASGGRVPRLDKFLKIMQPFAKFRHELMPMTGKTLSLAGKALGIPFTPAPEAA